MSAHQFHGIIDERGEFLPEQECAWSYKQLVRLLKKQRVTVTLGKFRKKRSLEQNGWYWAVFIPTFAENQGMDRDECHEAVKFKLLGTKDLPNGMRVPCETKNMTTVEFSKYMEDCQRYAFMEWGCFVPMPMKPGDRESLEAHE